MKNSIKQLFSNPNQIIITSVFSVVITILFAGYNAYLGVIHNDAWGISISVYYLCLIIARTVVLITEKNLKTLTDQQKDNKRQKLYIGLSIFMFFIDLCLIAPITLMVIAPKDVKFGIIPSLVVAVYTVYKVTMAIINYKTANRFNNLAYKFLRELSVVDALVSLLTLQHVLIMVNGGMTKQMMTLSACSSFGILLVIIVFSVLTMIFNTKKSGK